jgi:hypothetical protein
MHAAMSMVVGVGALNVRRQSTAAAPVAPQQVNFH